LVRPTTTTRSANKPVIGLIGGIGSGKSYVARLLAQYGGYVVEADRLGHEALRQPDIRAAIVRRWGRGVLNEDGEINRRRLADIVFADAEQRRALEAIVHPYIARRLQEEIARARDNPTVRFIVIDAALLLETGWHQLCDYLVFVEAPDDLRQARATQSRGWSAAEWQARESAQWPLAEKRHRADAVIENRGDDRHLHQQLESLLHAWLGNRSPGDTLPTEAG
jgi:dephospho-CoA kinase